MKNLGSRKITKSAETCFLFCDHRWIVCYQKYVEITPSANKHGNGKSVLYRTIELYIAVGCSIGMFDHQR